MADRPIFHIDRCLGKAVAAALATAGANVRIHDDYFSQSEADEVWIPEVSRRGWVILTKDKNIRRRHEEREAALLSEARIFTLSSGGMHRSVMAAIFIKHLDAMEVTAQALQPPFLAVVGDSGIEIIYPLSPSDPSNDDKTEETAPQEE